MAKTLRPLLLLAVLLLPVTPFLASTERQNHKEIHVIDGGVYWDVNAGIELGVWETIGVLQEALERRAPAWAQYRWQDSRGREHSLAEYIWDAAHTQMIGVNPRVLLVTAGMALDWQVPKGKDLPRAISEVGVTLTQHERAFRFDEALRARYPQVANAGSYALYAFFGYDREKLHAWRQTYEELFGRGALILAATPTPNATPRPFMARPFAQPPAPTPFYTIYSFLDHNAPYIYDEPTLTRFDGLVLDTQGGCVGGKSCYSGHEGLDYTTGRDYPAVQPPVYAVGDGVVTAIFEPCGQVEVLHEDEQVVSVYMHMENIQVARNQRVDTDTLLGYTGNVANGVNCRSTGPHLHFHAYFQHDQLAFLEPFGWWDAAGDPDPLEDYREDGWSGSWWLWRGDEAGDGYLVVDNRESQAQLFYLSSWWYDAAGYGNASWWTYSVTDENDSTNWGIWGAQIETSGLYCLSAYWPRRPQNTTTAQYRIFSQAQGLLSPAVVVNQREQGDTWVPLGEYALARGPSVVILTDFVGPNGTAQERVYFDAVKWAPGPCATPTPTPTATPTATPSPTPTPTSTPTATPTPWPTPPPNLTPGPGEHLAQCNFSLSVSQGAEATHWCGRASTTSRAAFLSWSGTYTRPGPFAGAVLRVLRSGPEVGIFNAYDLAYEKYDPGPDGGSGTWGETVEIPDAVWGMGAEGDNVPGPLIWLVSNCFWGVCGSAQVSGVLYYIAPDSTPTPTPTPTSPSGWSPAEQVLMQDEPALRRAAFSDLLSRIRDQVLLAEPKGKAYVQMVYHHAPEITRLLAEDEGLRAEVKTLVLEVQPLLEAIIADQPSQQGHRLSEAWIEKALRVLEEVERRASPELKREIQWWKERLPEFVGKTGLEIWEMLPVRSR